MLSTLCVFVCWQNFREPLYLTDKPRLLPDTRTEEEIKYPELFRHRVQAH